jgi:hypothetical protein
MHARIKISKIDINICFCLHPKVFRYTDIVVWTVITIGYVCVFVCVNRSIFVSVCVNVVESSIIGKISNNSNIIYVGYMFGGGGGSLLGYSVKGTYSNMRKYEM